VISSIRLGKEHFLGLGLAIDPNTNTLYGQGFRSLVAVDLANQNHRALSLNSSWFTVAGIVVVAGGSLFIARMRRRRPSAS
jgi:LPXTG-motif cell wall-anchored protein